MNDDIDGDGIAEDATDVSTPDGEPDGGPKSDVPEKTMAERAKELGRDGAYLEVDATGLVQAYRDGSLSRAKMIVVKAARIELSSDSDIANLQAAVGALFSALVAQKEGVADMSDEQASMFMLKDCLGIGMTIKGTGNRACGS